MAAFQSRPGFKPVRHLTGAPYNGQMSVYALASGGSVVPGDVVKLAADGTAGGVPYVTNVSGATDVPVGIVMQITNSKLDPVTGKMTAGSISLDTPQAATTQGQIVLVADSPDLVFETEIATYAVANINANHQLVVTTYNTTTGASNMKIVYNAGAQADPVRLMGVRQMNQPLGAGAFAIPADADTNVKVEGYFNVHAYKNSAGVAGV